MRPSSGATRASSAPTCSQSRRRRQRGRADAGQGRASAAAHCPLGGGLRPACMQRGRRRVPSRARGPNAGCARDWKGAARRAKAPPGRARGALRQRPSPKPRPPPGRRPGACPMQGPRIRLPPAPPPFAAAPCGTGPPPAGGGEGRGGTAEPGGRRPPRPATRIAWRQRDGVIPCLAAERFAHLPYRAAAGTQALVRHASVALSRMIKHGRTRQSNDGGEGIRTRAIVCRLSPTINSQ